MIDLALLCRRYQESFYTSETFEDRLRLMLPAVDSLEEIRNKLLSLLKYLRKRGGEDIRVLEEICKGVEKRCLLLTQAFKELDRRL